jgi:nucleotide-binding universal stress UspA family protein
VRRYLVVANQTLEGDELVRVISACAEAEPSEFFIVVPATPLVEMWVAAVMTPYGGVQYEPEASEQARELAEERLDAAAAQLRAAGATVAGEVGDRDPVRAVEEALRARTFDEIIVSTLPGRISRWLHQDLPRRLEQFGMPVTHVTDAKHAAR